MAGNVRLNRWKCAGITLGICLVQVLVFWSAQNRRTPVATAQLSPEYLRLKDLCLEASHDIQELPQPETPIFPKLTFGSESFPRQWHVKRVVLHDHEGVEYGCLLNGTVTLEGQDPQSRSATFSEVFQKESLVGQISQRGITHRDLDISSRLAYSLDEFGERHFPPGTKFAEDFPDPPLSLLPQQPVHLGKPWPKHTGDESGAARHGDRSSATVTGTFVRAVRFDGREAVLVQSRVTYPLSPGTADGELLTGGRQPVTVVEDRRHYVDISTGWILWSERKVMLEGAKSGVLGFLANHPMVIREEVVTEPAGNG